MSKEKSKVRLFIYNHQRKFNKKTLAYSSGYISELGVLTGYQEGATETFYVGMPIYTMDNQLIGNLSLGLYKNLNYSSNCKVKIPVEHWRVDGYRGIQQKIKTFYQLENE